MFRFNYLTEYIYWIDDRDLSIYDEIDAWCNETYGKGNWGTVSNVENIQYMFNTEKELSLFLLRWPNLKYWGGWFKD